MISNDFIVLSGLFTMLIIFGPLVGDESYLFCSYSYLMRDYIPLIWIEVMRKSAENPKKLIGSNWSNVEATWRNKQDM